MWLDGSLYVAGAAEHLEAHRHRRRRRGRQARRVVRGQDAHRLRQRPARPVPRAATAGSTGARARSPSRRTPGRTAASSRRRPRTSSAAGPTAAGIEPVMTGGMDNPVDVVFTPGGERIFTTTFFSTRRRPPRRPDPRGLRRRLRQGPRRARRPSRGPAELMPVLVAPGPGRALRPGPLRVRRRSATTTATTCSLCQFNLHKVTRHVLTPQRAARSPRDDSDFVCRDNLDFHPTDVLEDADGSLLVVDTGGWYKLCCPTSQLWKPDVLGGDLPRAPRRRRRPTTRAV